MTRYDSIVLSEGQPFPNFSLKDQDGADVSLADLKGRKTIIYFYPKDDTTGCTVEACEFRDSADQTTDARIIGVSPDSVRSHRKFIDKYGLNFTLLADPDHSLCEAAGVWVEKSMYGRTYMGVERTTFVLDEEGLITKVFRKVKPQGHASQVLSALA